MPRCPRGHESHDAEFCDRCGIQISGSQGAPGAQALVRQGDIPADSIIGPASAPDRYVVSAKLGQGGFGATYLGEDRQERRQCVLKEFLPPPDFTPDELRSMTDREKQLLATLNHPGLPSVWDAFSWQGREYMVMSYEAGETLEDLAGRAGGRLAEPELVSVAMDIARILGYLHAQSPPVIHRDIKPDNILRRPDASHALLDFGAARVFDASKSKDTVALGTKGYAAPEVEARSKSDERSDLYSLGASLYRAAIDHDPASDPFRFPSLDRSGLSEGMREVLERLVRTKPEQRFGSAQELIVALEGLSDPSHRCPSCGRPVRPEDWRCTCGHSMLPKVSWSTLGGSESHGGRVADLWPDKAIGWRTSLRSRTHGGPVGADGIAAILGCDGSLMGIDIASGSHRWATAPPRASTAAGGPALVAKHVVAVLGNEIWAFDIRLGTPRQVAHLDESGPYELTPIGSMLHVVSHSGHRWSIDLASGSIERWHDLGYEVRHGPVCYADRVVYVGVRGEMTCLARGSRGDIWTSGVAGQTAAGLVLAGKWVASVSTSGELSVLDVDTGAEVISVDVNDTVYATPSAAGDTVVVTGKSFLAVADISRGGLLRHSIPSGMRVAAPILMGTSVITTETISGRLITVDASSGQIRELGDANGKVSGWLCYVDGWAIVATEDGVVTGVGPR